MSETQVEKAMTISVSHFESMQSKIDELYSRVAELERLARIREDQIQIEQGMKLSLKARVAELERIQAQALEAMKLTTPFSKHSREKYQAAITAIERQQGPKEPSEMSLGELNDYLIAGEQHQGEKE